MSRTRFGPARIVLIGLVTGLGAGIAILVSSAQLPTYRATAKVFAGAVEIDSPGAGTKKQPATAERVASYTELLESRTLAEQVVEEAELSLTPVEVTRRLDSEVVEGTRVILVSFTDALPERARDVANSAALLFASGRVEGFEDVQAKVFERALLPVTPSGPRPARDGLGGALAGATLATIVVSLSRRTPQPDLAPPSPPETAGDVLGEPEFTNFWGRAETAPDNE